MRGGFWDLHKLGSDHRQSELSSLHEVLCLGKLLQIGLVVCNAIRGYTVLYILFLAKEHNIKITHRAQPHNTTVDVAKPPAQGVVRSCEYNMHENKDAPKMGASRGATHSKSDLSLRVVA